MTRILLSIFIVFMLLLSCKQERREMDFEQERLSRIKKDFTKTEEQVRQFIQEYIPDVTDEQMRNWENNRALEWMEIEGQKRYFKYAARNLFRIDPTAREIWNTAHPEQKNDHKLDLDKHNLDIIEQVTETGQPYVKPIRMQITYSISVDADAVPPGETVRCWIPYPIEIPGRQTGIDLITTNPALHQLAAADQKQRTIYFEGVAQGGETTDFSVTYA